MMRNAARGEPGDDNSVNALPSTRSHLKGQTSLINMGPLNKDFYFMLPVFPLAFRAWVYQNPRVNA